MKFRKQAQFDPKDADLNRRLVALENELDRVLRELDAAKDDRLVARESSQAQIQADFGDWWLIDNDAQAVEVYLPQPSPDRVDHRVAVLFRSASFSGTVIATGNGVLIDAAATYTGTAGTLAIFRCDGEQWWT